MNSDSTQNYVDRVRIPDSSYIFGGPGRGSGWRQRSLSNIDLTSQTRHSFTKQKRDYSSGLYDLYSRIESRKDYQNIHKFSDHSISNKHSESIYDHIKPDIPLGPDSCSLRRTRSLAVIREETYNDLQINGSRTRRSQLIPRAKLVNRSFFKNRQHRFREEDSGSGVDTQTSETRESDDYYANLKKLDLKDTLKTDSPWVNDKSDLDSLDSDYFKNSLHQPPLHYSRETTSELLQDQEQGSETEEKSAAQSKIVSITESEVADFNNFEEVTLASNQEDSDSIYDNCKLTYNTNTLTLTRFKISDFDNEIIDKRSKFKEDGKSVVSYDSIYLSSEGSNEHTVVQETVEDPLPDFDVNETGEFINDRKSSSSLEDQDQPSLDSLYSQIKKNKPKIISLEPKTNLTSFSDTSTRGTLERLTFISTTPQAQKKDFSQVEGKRFSTEPFVGTLIDNQYCSLPDVSIGLSLRASERIDEKLRLSCIIPTPAGDANNNSIYDSISRFGKAHKRLRQRESLEVDEVKSTTTVETLKEAEIIELKEPKRPIESNEQLITVSNQVISHEEHPTTINLGRKKIIVDELAAKEHNSLKEGLSNESSKLEATKIKKFSDIKIIITDVQNNIVDEPEDFCKEASIPVAEIQRLHHIQKKEIAQEKQKLKVESVNNRIPNVPPSLNPFTPKSIDNETKENVPYAQPREQTQIQTNKPFLRKTKSIEPAKDLVSEFKANLTDTLRKRIAESRNIFNARPIRISSEEHIEKLNDTYEINSSVAYKIKFKEQSKMSRPQILTVVDSKRNVCSVAPRQTVELMEERNKSTKTFLQTNKMHKPEVQQEFQEKVDSVRCYWSKLIEENGHHNVDEVDHEISSDRHQQQNENVRNYIASVEKQNMENSCQNRDRKIDLNDNEDFTSFSPSVEIIDLDGQKHAAVVKNQNFDTQDFDHIRYKVMRSDTFQKNILAHNRKEAQFDGLLQYLHNYSFQELLASNNVVIIEPIRTKIEKPSTKSNEPQTVNCKITGGAGKSSESNKSGLKRHFFYHPIRVNKELLDEELPNPDTVRNARKLFEETLRLRQKRDDAITGNVAKANENLRKKALRYLTIDTSFGDGVKKWDSSSVSSGISSGELSSPCECNDHDDGKEEFSSGENICDDESYYVSQDILEKIRECGSSVTYYGGRVVDNKSTEVSPMTKAIMQEIRGQNKMCGVCQPNNCPHQTTLFPKVRETDNSNLGLKFKLVKSNSCSSRLELSGTGIDEEKLRDTKYHISTIENSSMAAIQDAEESVRTLVNRLETGAINQKLVPRIIESKCIEKFVDPNKITQTEPEIDTSVSINNQMIDEQQSRLGPVDILRQVTVNNHINFSPPVVVGDNGKNTTMAMTTRNQQHQNNHHHSPETLRINKVPRNRNVDLAFTMNKTAKEAKDKSDEMKKVITNEVLLEPDQNQQVNKTSFRNAKNVLNETNDNETQMTIQVCSKKREIDVGVCNANEGSEQQQKQQSTQSPRQLVKWNTLSHFDEKNYVANDVKLKQKPKYDEIEFEEFEVYDPNNANNDCYDSLNDK